MEPFRGTVFIFISRFLSIEALFPYPSQVFLSITNNYSSVGAACL
jgi:hypothetical protein